MKLQYMNRTMVMLCATAVAMIIGACDSETTVNLDDNGSIVIPAPPQDDQPAPEPVAATVLPICTADAGSEPWTSDGSTDGTVMLKDINEGWKGSVPRKMGGNGHNNKFVVMGLDTFFPARMQHVDDENNTYETFALWVSDGTTEGTVMLRDFNKSFSESETWGLAQFAVMGGNIYFRGWDEEHGYQIWKSDGTVQGTVRVTNFPVENDSHSWYEHQIGGIRALDNVVTFHASEEDHGEKALYATDGTWEGTKQLLVFGEDWSYRFKVADGRLYFENEDTKGREPWVSDGTVTGTHIVADVRLGESSSDPEGFTAYNGAIYFAAYADLNGSADVGKELVRSNGTQEGTEVVKDINVGSSNSYPEGFTVFNGLLYFNAYDGEGRTLWRTDGTEAGTVKVFGEAWNDFDPEAITVAGDKLYFRGRVVTEEEPDATATIVEYNNEALYEYDGTATEPRSLVMSDNIGNFRVVDDELWFQMDNNDENDTTSLWRTDSATGGMIKIKDNMCPAEEMDGVNPDNG